MSDSRRPAMLIAGAIAYGALLVADPTPLPVTVRVLLAFAALILWPGFALVRLLGVPPGGRSLAVSWALGFGVAWNAVLLIATAVLRVPFTALLPWAPWLSLALWVVAIVATRRRDRLAATTEAARRLDALPHVLVLVAAGLAAWHAWRFGAPLTYLSDSPDHIGTIRRMLEHGRLFPTDAFFADAGALGADPRKGLWHPQVALLCRLAQVDPVQAWRELPIALAPLFVLAAASLGFLLRGGAGAAVAAFALLVTYGGGLAHQGLREAVYATKLADQLALSTFVAVLADLARPARATRVAAVVLGFAAVVCHVFAVLEFALVFGTLGLLLLVRDRGFGPQVRRLAIGASLIGVACLPYVVWRMHGSYAPNNPIHTEPQGLLWLFGEVRTVTPGVLWEWMSVMWIAVPLSWWPLWKHGRNQPAALYLLAASLAAFVVMFCPPVVALLQPRLGYLLMRMVWIIPFSGLLAWALPELAARVRRGGRLAALALGALLLLSVPMVGAGFEALLHPRQMAEAEAAESPLAWEAPLAWLDSSFANPQVVLSDPATSYAVPMLTRHYVVTLLDQHSSPSDSLALRRLIDARDALDPYGSWENTRSLVDRYGVDVVALNGTFASPPGFDYWAPGPAWYAASRARLDSHPEAFERIYDRDRFAIYRVRRAALDSLTGGERSRPFVFPFVSGKFPIALRLEEGRPVLHRLRIDPSWARPGDTLRMVADWRAIEPQPSGSYRVSVRFDRSLPAGFAPPASVAKPLRKILERVRHERYRFREDHLPARSEYPVDLWTENEVVRDSFEVVVPRDVAEGRYAVQLRMFREPHYQNLHVSDYFSDQDRYSGPAVGVLNVARELPDWKPAARPTTPSRVH